MKKAAHIIVLLLFLSINPQWKGFTAIAAPQQGQNLEQFLNQVWLIVTPIEIWCGPSRLATATGFFFENESKLYLITNRHVVRVEDQHFFPDKLKIRLHTNREDPTQNTDYDVPLYRDRKSLWREKARVDLVALELNKDEMSRFALVALSPNFVLPGNAVVAAGDDVLIVGYPFGFYDFLHNYPIARTGAVASAYPLPFQGQPYFLVDARLHPGTSGSPVLLKPSNMLKTNATTFLGDYHIFFLGVNSGQANFPGESSGLNSIWYASEVVDITASSFHSQTFVQQ